MRIYCDSFLCNLRMMRCRIVQVKRELFSCGESPLTLRPDFKSKKGNVTADKPPVCPAGGVLSMRIYCDSFLCNLRMMRCRIVQVKRELFSCGESPLTLRPDFKSKKGNVTADKPPVCPAGGVLLIEKCYIFG